MLDPRKKNKNQLRNFKNVPEILKFMGKRIEFYKMYDFGSLLKAAPSLIQATKPQPTYGYGYPVTTVKPATPSTGISTNTLLLVAAAGLGIYFFTKKKRR